MFRCLLALFMLPCFVSLKAENTGNTIGQLNQFYDVFLCEQKNETATVGLTATCTGSSPGSFPCTAIASLPTATRAS